MLIVVNRSGVIDKNVYSSEFLNEQLYQISSFFFVFQIRLEDFRARFGPGAEEAGR